MPDTENIMTPQEKVIESFEYFRNRYGWSVTIKDFYMLMLKTPGLSEIIRRYINHENGYCYYIKTSSEAFLHCVEVSNKVLCEKITSGKVDNRGFWGICYCGVREYVVPVFCRGYAVGAVIAGSHRCCTERQKSTFELLSRNYGFDKKALEDSYYSNLPEKLIEPDMIEKQAELWATALELLCEKYIDERALEPVVNAGVDASDLNSARLNQAVHYIKMNLSEKLTVEKIARVCYCSESTIAHLFRETLDTSVINFVINERLRLAKQLLVQSDMPISEIAKQCGFVTNKYFTGVFKSREGVSPKEYRTECKKN